MILMLMKNIIVLMIKHMTLMMLILMKNVIVQMIMMLMKNVIVLSPSIKVGSFWHLHSISNVDQNYDYDDDYHTMSLLL